MKLKEYIVWNLSDPTTVQKKDPQEAGFPAIDARQRSNAQAKARSGQNITRRRQERSAQELQESQFSSIRGFSRGAICPLEIDRRP